MTTLSFNESLDNILEKEGMNKTFQNFCDLNIVIANGKQFALLSNNKVVK